MHDIEPHFRWRDEYIAAEDERSPFYGQEYSEFEYTHRLYNYYLHPQWDSFGSSTLYGKLLYADYEERYALVELIGEWNDTLHNDIHYLKRHLADPLYDQGIVYYVFFCDNVLNFHAGLDDDYYAEWHEELSEEGGWVVLINTRQHLFEEMEAARLDRYLHFGQHFNNVNWRSPKPAHVFALVEQMVGVATKKLHY